ncbi:hypothetical protein [Actinokineospora sp. NBRC 105648]|uniref:hypothetical protein n=1 Tax=Actinokineospora sp. NBRC 105648 TaxID=3032206 RepID=UPI0024A5563E|nr:hypothetical protein [Actinokineospora sp. NBRC 105648]GLZ39876.1 cell division protein DivIVA [Actinokineospora sp. NBRC 105648]
MASQQDRDHVGFTVVRHGFDRAQVKQHIQDLETTATTALAQRDEAVAKAEELAGQLELARREIDALNARLDKIGTAAAASSAPNAPERSARADVVAKAQAAEITSRAQAAADTAWSAAEEASTALRERYRRLLAELDKQHTEIHAAHKTIMDEARAKVDQMTTVAEQRQREVDERAERERQRLEQQFQQDLTSKRDHLAEEIAAAHSAAEQEADRRLRAATDEADKRIATATSHVEQLTALREQLAGRLRGTSDLLDQSAKLLQPIEAEAELDQLPLSAEPPAAQTQPVRKPQKAPAR